MPGVSAARTIAWVCAEEALPRQLALETIGVSQDEIQEAYAREEGVAWAIENAYYDADVWMRFGSYVSGAPAAILLVDRAMPATRHAEVLQRLERVHNLTGFDLDVSLVVGVPSREKASSMSLEVDEVYAMGGWEYIDLGDTDEDPATRLKDALMVHMWEGMRPKQAQPTPSNENVKERIAHMDQSAAALPRSGGAIPPAPRAMQASAERFLSDAPPQDTPDDDFSEFVEAPAPDVPTDAEVDAYCARLGLGTLGMDSMPVLFERLRGEMERVRSLPPGPPKEHAAALVALAVERSLESE